MIEPKQECKISRDISKRILCLPIYAELEKDIIIKTIKENAKENIIFRWFIIPNTTN